MTGGETIDLGRGLYARHIPANAGTFGSRDAVLFSMRRNYARGRGGIAQIATTTIDLSIERWLTPEVEAFVRRELRRILRPSKLNGRHGKREINRRILRAERRARGYRRAR